MRTFVSGYIRSPEDPRDWRVYSLRPYREFPHAYSVPEIERVPILDQGERGTCVAHAAATMKVWQELRERGEVHDLSEEYLYGRCKEHDGIPHEEGTYPSVAMAVLRAYGICTEKSCPYQARDHMIALDEAMDLDASPYRIVSYARVRSHTEMRAALMTYGPVLIGVPVYENWMTSLVAGTGIIPRPQGDPIGGHALLVYGWTRNNYLIRNSWGQDWGKSGNGQLAFTYPGLYDDAWLSVDLSGEARLRQSQ